MTPYASRGVDAFLCASPCKPPLVSVVKRVLELKPRRNTGLFLPRRITDPHLQRTQRSRDVDSFLCASPCKPPLVSVVKKCWNAKPRRKHRSFLPRRITESAWFSGIHRSHRTSIHFSCASPCKPPMVSVVKEVLEPKAAPQT